MNIYWTRLKDIVNLILQYNIPEELILNLDQTPLGFTSASKVTFAPMGSKKVPISNIDDKRQITGTFTVSIKGDFLLIQLIYTGLTDRCHPKVKFPKNFPVTHSANHWSNEQVHMEYLKKTIFPHLENVRDTMNLGDDREALLIYEVFRGQTTNTVTTELEKNNCLS